MNQSTMKKLPYALAIALGTGVTTIALSGNAIAQTPAPVTPQKIEKIEVTGSNIKRVDAEGVAAVQVITRAEIEQSGASTIAEVLRNITSNSGGSFNETFTNSFSPGAAGISLRGLGQKATLVLINGRRTANYGFAQNLQDTYVDLNSIPQGAVERIEILKDGASAVYGSDAIGGVINVITRKDYRGGEISLSGGTSSEGGLNEYRTNGAIGFGDLSKDRYNVLATLDYFQRDLLLYSQRKFTASQDYRDRVGGVLNYASGASYRTTPRQPFANCGQNGPLFTFPGNQLASTGTLCVYNTAPFLTLFPKTERIGSLVRGSFDISSTLSAFAEVNYSKNKSFQKFTPAAVAPTSVAFNPATGGITVVNGTLPVGNSSNPFTTPTGINYTFFDVGGRDSDINSTSYRAVAGLKGAIANWDWEVGAGKSQNKVEQLNYNRVDRYVLTTAIAANTYNFLSPANGSIRANNLRINPSRKSTSDLDFIDLKASGEIATLPAGPVGFAVGAEYRKESINDVPDKLITGGNVLGQGATATDGARNNTAGFFEFSVPVFKSLELQLAGRQDKYSDFGSAFSPKGGFKWTVAKEFILRGTVSRGFRAPTLPENSRSSATFFVGVTDTFPGSPNVGRAVTIAGVFAGNPALKAEKSKNENLGAVWEPSPDLSFGLTWYKIRQNDIVSANGFQFIVNNPTRFPGAILRAADGTLISVSDGFRNLAYIETSGLDIDFKKSFNAGNYGKFTLTADANYVAHFKTPPALGEEAIDYVDENGFGSIPRYKVNAALTWDKGDWTSTLSYRYTHSWDQTGVAVPPAQDRVGAYRQYNLFASYSGFKNLKLTASVQNVLDAKPPFDPSFGGGWDNTQNDLRGRYFTLGATYTFK